MRLPIKRFAPLFWFAGALLAQPDAVVRAMRDELDRSMKKLELDKLEKPYFISYKVVDTDSEEASASFGSRLGSSENRARVLNVEVRVGDYAFDDTNFLNMDFGGVGVERTLGINQLPLDDNYDEIRRQLWLATDAAYKKALDDLARKRAALQNKNRTDVVPDFSKEKPTSITDMGQPIRIGLAEAEARVTEASAVFREIPGVFDSRVRMEVTNSLTRYINSEGTFFTGLVPSISLSATAATQATDGQPLTDFVAIFGRDAGDLPPRGQLAATIRAMGTRLARLREAPLAERYNGPVLFEPDAAAELFSQVFAQQILGRPHLVSDNSQFQSALEGLMGPQDDGLLDKVGAHVMPEFLSLVDNPTMAVFGQTPLLGAYKVDEDGVPARQTVIVENGILKTLLTGRAPVRGILQSSGNRRALGVMPGNLLLTASKTMSADALRAELLHLVKQRGREYGIIVRRIGNPAFKGPSEQPDIVMFTSGQSQQGAKLEPVIAAYKLFPDGHEELIRNAAISGLGVSTFKEIVAASDQPGVYTAPFTVRTANPFSIVFAAMESMPVVSWVIPSLLFEDLTVQRPSGDVAKPPFSKHPSFDQPAGAQGEGR